MSNKTEIMYNMVFLSIKKIITQNNLYKLNIVTISTDQEAALINAINYTFENI